MKTLRRILAAAALCVGPATAQQFWPYTASTGAATVSGSSYAATLQQPAATCGANGTSPCSSQVVFPASAAPGGQRPMGGASNAPGAAVTCSVGCTFTVIVGATAATTTAGTVNPAYGSGAPPPSVQFFTNSNYSGGTTVVGPFSVGAGSTVGVDLSDVKLAAGGNGVNITILIASLTGTVNIIFYPLEAH